MARAARSNALETRTNRTKLAGGKTEFVAIGDGLSLGYRRSNKQANGTWWARLWNGEKYLKHSLGEADDYLDANGETVVTYWQASDKARAFMEEANKPHLPKGKPVTVRDAAEHYLKWYKEHRKAYRETEASVNAHILPAWGDRLLMEITTRELNHWRDKLATTPPRKRSSTFAKSVAYRDTPTTEEGKRARKSTANRILTVFKAIANKAFHDDLVSDDTAWRKVKPFANADEPVTRFLTEAESARLINACAPDFRPLVKAALFTGARYGEIARLQVKDVNVDTGMVYISAEAKSGKGRYVPLSPEGLDFIESAIAGKTGKDMVFLRSDGNQWGKNHHVRLLKAACQQGKIEPAIGFHELRHTYASALAQMGVDLLTISKLLGHADTRVTSRHYAHLCDKTLKDAVARLPGFGHQPETKVQAIR